MDKNAKTTYLLLLVFTVLLIVTTIAQASSGDECLRAVVDDISPSSVGIDEQFTVGISLESCGNTVPDNITFEIISSPPDIVIIESLVTHIPKFVYSGSERQLIYHMKTTPDAKPGPHIIKMKLTYGNDAKWVSYYDVEVTVTGEHAEPRISSVKTNPEYIYEGDTVDLSLGIDNFGKAIAKSVEVSLEHGFKGIKNSTIGTLGLNGSQTALFKFKTNRTGTFAIPVIIEYEDDYGIQKDNYSIMITVLDKKGSLNLASVKVTPVLPQVGDTVELTMRIENSGERTISSVRVYADHPFKGLKESFIGTLDPNGDGPAVLTFIANQSGEYEIPVTITYSDDFGEEQIRTNINLIVLKSDSSYGTVLIILLILGVIGGLIYINYRTKKSKDKIIKQLMEGRDNSDKNEK
ncbi:COG1361 S-layer family protein [uncultured Methanomethylovorans sp.]|uniref:COG1361 S-layer family protein n=1 Tax=uncultured Methanomethylovorans sp. TaxID=183759 RepID=UPI002AA8D4A3|nr:COG1361 S-layer family protein [uncultured Methanomethylovorans sp.]